MMCETTVPLEQIALTRSGDDGNQANLSVVALTAAGYDWIRDHLTARRVEAFFAPLGITQVERHEMPRIGTLLFVLPGLPADEPSRSLRLDSRGHLLGAALGELRIPRPDHLDRMVQV